jgi:hypothetical protein
MLMTDWGDDGHYQAPSNSWYPYLWAAECGWTGGETESAAFDAAFARLFLADASRRQVAALRRLGAAMQTEPDWVRTWHSAVALWEEPLLGQQAEVAPAEAVTEAKAAAEGVLAVAGEVRDPLIRHDLGFAAAQVRFAARKVETTRAIRALLNSLAGQAAPTDEGRARLDEAIAALRRQRDELPPMVREFEARWLTQARRSEIETNLARFARLSERYAAAIAWLEGQRAAYEAGEGVDGALATYDGGDYAVLHDASRRNILELIEIVGLDALPPDLRGWVEREATGAG